MKRRHANPLFCALTVVLAAFCAPLLAAAGEPGQNGKIRVLVVTGGHDFETNQFLQMFKDTPAIAWAKTYQKARVVYLQLGHDHLAYENPNYRRLLAQAIQWVGRRR